MNLTHSMGIAVWENGLWRDLCYKASAHCARLAVDVTTWDRKDGVGMQPCALVSSKHALRVWQAPAESLPCSPLLPGCRCACSMYHCSRLRQVTSSGCWLLSQGSQAAEVQYGPQAPAAQKQRELEFLASANRTQTAISMQHPDLSGTFPGEAASSAQARSVRTVRIELDQVSLGPCQPLVICTSVRLKSWRAPECEHS